MCKQGGPTRGHCYNFFASMFSVGMGITIAIIIFDYVIYVFLSESKRINPLPIPGVSKFSLAYQ
jgi:hypothetical protein